MRDRSLLGGFIPGTAVMIGALAILRSRAPAGGRGLGASPLDFGSSEATVTRLGDLSLLSAACPLNTEPAIDARNRCATE